MYPSQPTPEHWPGRREELLNQPGTGADVGVLSESGAGPGRGKGREGGLGRTQGFTCGCQGGAAIFEQKTGVRNTALGGGWPAGMLLRSEGKGVFLHRSQRLERGGAAGPRNGIKGRGRVVG